MIDLVSKIIVAVLGLLSIGSAIVVARELITGSYRQYAEKRRLHLEQLHRVQEELGKGRKP